MSVLMQIHARAQQILGARYTMTPVRLKHPFPERPWRAAGLMRIDGEVFATDKLLRVVFIRPQLPCFFAVRSMFVRPRVELDLPVFAGEVMRTGAKKMVIVDIHRTGKTHHDDRELFARMRAIRDRYPDLTAHTRTQSADIQQVFSPAACQVSIPPELDVRAADLLAEYLELFCDLVDAARPMAGDALRETESVFEEYLKTLVDHDPGVRIWKVLFGARGGVERSMDMHFGR